jgi:hypothetical protein
MMHDQNPSMILWAQACMKQHMFRTRVFHQILKNITPEEIAFQRSRESQMEIDSETMPSPHSVVQRETNIIPADPVAPVNMFRDQKESL